MKKLIGFLFLLFITCSAFAQKQEGGIVQFTGIVHNADSTGAIVPYVSIVNGTNKNQVNISNYMGYFSFPAHERDTIRFSCVGYASVTVVIPSNVPSKSYTLQVMLKPQIINLPVFKVFPWATTEEFRKDFITMKVADDDLEIARKNLSRSSILGLQRTLPRDGSEMNGFQDFHNSVVNSHSITNPLLNPFNWGSLIREISEGDKARNPDTN
ncbi:carboxypeptidase-like regulatory domain-containing protein [Mucilaginibacter sp. BJC16-A38]|uniref:carboxypeptidase-like regulatory domain-containing protein n=1 Tax=Mucilaginibacter phenanthrenivorans TaxID=1234842 RepID=UPI002158460D|nr:carboxypeptidase-like regulatory domain-containing protein [Mucilaginibacter phenanthrenivorans]MCR8560987.1 carboxypeptidase-like regulatory domain-containing protein [Mucilaginibacter phenanthrenivorans]